MSSPKTTAEPAPGRGRETARSLSKLKHDVGTENQLSADAMRVAAQVERAVRQGRTEVLTPQALQALVASACKLYAAKIEAGDDILPLHRRSNVSPTEVMLTASGLLRSVNLAVFELGMWQSWTGR
jgi:hypothetical protein